jgi:F0F1-type ATP synthase membrane subunit b/b'
MTQISPYIDMLLKLLNVIALLYAFYKFTRKPGDDILTRLSKIEVKLDEIERSLNRSWEEHRAQKETNEVMQNCVLAIIDFELSYCIRTNYAEDTSDLEEAKTVLRTHLSKK